MKPQRVNPIPAKITEALSIRGNVIPFTSIRKLYFTVPDINKSFIYTLP
jgi:hypothetical protein